MLTEAAAQVAPVVSEARTLDRFIAPAQERLWSLARNLWWSWDHDSDSLFRDLDPVRWRQLNHNPISLLREIPSGEARAPRRGTGAAQPHQLRLSPPAANIWRRTAPGARSHAGVLRPRPVAYFSAEFGLARIASDLFRRPGRAGRRSHQERVRSRAFRWSASDLFYGQGYFRQRLDANGWQQEEYLQTDVNQLPMEPAIGTNGEPVTVQIDTRSGSIRAKVWRVKVGRCDLLLLDSNVEGNAPEDRELTSRLYGGDRRIRIRQELLLGVGGFRALQGHGHHARRAAPERRAQRVRRAGSDSQPHAGGRPRASTHAVPRVSREVVFTTHTPVPAGHDRFERDLIEEHLGPLRDGLGISHERLMGLGRENPEQPSTKSSA